MKTGSLSHFRVLCHYPQQLYLFLVMEGGTPDHCALHQQNLLNLSFSVYARLDLSKWASYLFRLFFLAPIPDNIFLPTGVLVTAPEDVD